MDTIKVNLFNIPTVYLNDKKISFPLRKAEALFYYLIVNNKATRDELVGLLWADFNEKKAKKNLRNTMYKIRKTFGTDIILSSYKRVICINPEIKIIKDIDIFMEDRQKDIEVYTGEFLKGFYIKDAENFISWMMNKRDYYKDIYMKKLLEKIEMATSIEDYNNVEKYAKLLIEQDEFNEEAYRILMKVYRDQGKYNKAIDVYNTLSDVLENELGITPDINTTKLYEEIVSLKNTLYQTPNKGSRNFFYGRRVELQLLKDNYNMFIKNKIFKSIIILGEAGIGKTRLKEEFLKSIDNENIYLIEANCYQSERLNMLKPWHTVFSKIHETINAEGIDIPVLWKNVISLLFPCFSVDDSTDNINPVEKLDTLKYEVIENTILSFFDKVSSKKKILLVFEDLQWMDDMSISLLTSIILHINNGNIAFLGTLRNGYDEAIDKFMALMFKYDKINVIEIPRFSKEETYDFIKKALPNKKINKTIIDKIYKETEGNTFFMVEFLNILRQNKSTNVMTSKMKDILKSKILDLSNDAQKMLNIASMFFDEIPLDILQKISGKSELQIIDVIEQLKDKYIIKEVSDSNKIAFQFTHQKLREFVYLEQSPARRKILHDKIGIILENSLKNEKSDEVIYPKLVYHFSKSGNKIAALKYRIKDINRYLDFSHELFPEINTAAITNNEYLYMTKEKTIKYFNDIEKLINEVKLDYGINEEILRLEITFLHMKGRYFIKEGEYKEGINLIQEVINKSISINYYEYALKGYRQMIFYCIQTHNIQLMSKYLELGLQIAIKHDCKKDVAILLRLKGLYNIMTSEYEEAEELLERSIKIFTMLNKYENKYALNIAAAYKYIGDIRRYNMKFSDALNYYDKAISICEDIKVLRGITIFNTNAGQAAFDMGDYGRAREYFNRAIRVYNIIDSIWGRSIAQGYMSLLLIKEGNYKKALEYLKAAEKYAYKMKSPYELGLVYRVKSEIRANIDHNNNLKKVFSTYLPLKLEEYCDKGIELLGKVEECYEIDILRALKRGSGE